MREQIWITNKKTTEEAEVEPPKGAGMRDMIPLDDLLITQGLIEHTPRGWRATAKGKAAHVVIRDARYPPGTDPVWLEQHLAEVEAD